MRTPLWETAPGALVALLNAGLPLEKCDLYTITLQSGKGKKAPQRAGRLFFRPAPVRPEARAAPGQPSQRAVLPEVVQVRSRVRLLS